MDRGRMDTKTREVVLTTLLDIEKNHIFSNIALGTALRANQFMSKQDRAYITRMVEGVTEQRIKLDYIINQFSNTKVNKCKPLIRCVLRMGTYELFFMDSVPDSAACNLSVKLAVDHGFGSLRGFVNGVLRNIARNRDGIKYPDKNTSPGILVDIQFCGLVEILLQDYDSETVDRILRQPRNSRHP
ncbi:MAG: transcription antitermination factor NusB [Coprococcus sp.]